MKKIYWQLFFSFFVFKKKIEIAFFFLLPKIIIIIKKKIKNVICALQQTKQTKKYIDMDRNGILDNIELRRCQELRE